MQGEDRAGCGGRQTRLQAETEGGQQTSAHEPSPASACSHDILLAGTHTPSFTRGLWWLPHHDSRAESCDRLCGPLQRGLQTADQEQGA